MRNVYARARNIFYSLPIRNKKGKILLIESNPDHLLYFEVSQPDKLDNEFYNVIVKKPFTYKGFKLASIDLEFLTEKELKKELSK